MNNAKLMLWVSFEQVEKDRLKRVKYLPVMARLFWHWVCNRDFTDRTQNWAEMESL